MVPPNSLRNHVSRNPVATSGGRQHSPDRHRSVAIPAPGNSRRLSRLDGAGARGDAPAPSHCLRFLDLHQVVDLSPQAPLFQSSTPSPLLHTWRYSQWLWVGEELWIYAEVVTARQTHEIRLFRVPRHP